MEKDIISLKEKKETVSDLSIYDIYTSDVGAFPCLDSENNAKLMKEVFEIISQLDGIFKEIDCYDTKFKGKKSSWLAEKVEYYLSCCNDKELLIRLKKAYNKYLSVSNKVIEGNLRLVIEIAGKYKTNQIISFEDIIQYGNMGLMRAVEKYSPEYGTAFSTYAYIWIIQSINKNIRGVLSTYKVPQDVVYDNYSIINSYNDLCIKLGRAATIHELSEYIGRSVSDIEEMRMIFTDQISIDETLNACYGDSEATVGDFIIDPNADVFKDVNSLESLERMKTILSKCLTKRQFETMEKYIGLNGDSYTQEEIAVMLGLSAQRISKIKKDSIKKIKSIPSFVEDLID